MNYLFRDQWYQVPTYSPYSDCFLVTVKYSLPLFTIQPNDQRVIERSWRKISRFTLVEGPFSTINKIRSKRVQEFLHSDFNVVLAVGELQDNGEPVVCLGTRHPRSAEQMLFRRELLERVTVIPSENTFCDAVDQAMSALNLQLHNLDSIAGYYIYSDLQPPELARNFISMVAQMIDEAAPNKSQTGVFPNQVIKPRASAQSAKTSVTSGGAVVIGAGDYARTQIIPALQRAGVSLHTIVDLEPYLADYACRNFAFASATTDWRTAIKEPDSEIVIVASYHDSHAEIASAALKAGKKVIVEKPPVVTREDLKLLLKAVESSPDGFLEVGYNRRYAPFTRKAKQLLAGVTGPTSIICRIREVDIPDQHWYRWPKQGTRITGNVCHWIDLGIYLLGADCEPVEIFVTGPDLKHLDDEKGLNVIFCDGSSLSIITTCRGDNTLGVQEWIEIRRGALSIEVADYRSLIATKAGRILCRLRSFRNKGHSAMYKETLNRIERNLPALYTSRELELTSLITINAAEMVTEGVRSRILKRCRQNTELSRLKLDYPAGS